ncbi:phosphoenolpyruvate--protein phosphotransferase [Deinococcus cellulosilyticus]|uniref:phosphoenolpyruvate--protein phosphotransferase n=1 Tax=Deinococcus cellulosilyticus (strain DSM 18568 / NBRC 106333 / KACC 11606 / 5516J-15) TaxID=1223518 RepID=A0A511N256_DEIC1|nr:phosphoenolpyruvate--protein phosphotransferase [Deinococcus cellulosilyticus]GEM46929.1 phosphoenolpyruvate--protein phosphotransferase [Deinococcus cellulosilyticus NBRC 106333 = KACC 11606]
MLQLKREDVLLAAHASTQRDAIEQVAALLAQNGFIDPAYAQSMLEREQTATTYLAHGVAIPHGLPQHRSLVHKTGLAVLQIPEGVQWGPEKAHLLIGIASQSDEHLEILRRLTRVLGEAEKIRALHTTTSPEDIIEFLTGNRPEPEAKGLPDFPEGFEVVLPNPTGMHARPARNLVELVSTFDAQVRIRAGNRTAEASSMMDLLGLGASRGTLLHVSAQGKDAKNVLTRLKKAILEGLGDDLTEPVTETSHPALHFQASSGLQLQGLAASVGLAIGEIHQHRVLHLQVEDTPADMADETEKLQKALDQAQSELLDLAEGVRHRLGSGKAEIFQAQASLLEDPALIQQVVSTMLQGHSAAWAFQQVLNERIGQLKKLDDPVLAARAVDFSDVKDRVLGHLLGQINQSTLKLDRPVVLIAEDLTPSDTAMLDPDLILGFCTAVGGPTSHSAILARSLGIPAVVGAGRDVLSIPAGSKSILDGFSGTLYVEPSAEDIREAQTTLRNWQEELEVARAARHQPATTTDGVSIEVAANVNRASDVPAALENGAEGVGLMRTEFLFLESDHAPSEEEQYQAYRQMVEALQGKPLIVRTLDIGGDKEVGYLGLEREDNSFLGMRGIRLCFQRPDLFLPQLRAIYRAARHGPLKIMFPMVSTLEDFQKARDLAEGVRVEVGAPKVELGIMIEVPSAVMLAEELAREVDFFSIGTNDLTQYTLAMDRLHPELAHQADGLHPAVLRMIDHTVQAARKHGRWVGVCGGIAGDVEGALILTGLGVSELSVATPAVPTIKATLREKSHQDLVQLAQKALRCQTAREVRGLL